MSKGTARSDYKPGNILSAVDLAADQDYIWEHLRRHDRYLHGWGIVCGLMVVPERDPKRPLAIRVCPGYAVTPCGDEIDVPQAVTIDLADYLWTRPSRRRRLAQIAYILLRYDAEPRRPAPELPVPCGCGPAARVPSRLRDSFQIEIQWTPTASRVTRFNLCGEGGPPCPTIPNPPVILLATVRFATSGKRGIDEILAPITPLEEP